MLTAGFHETGGYEFSDQGVEIVLEPRNGRRGRLRLIRGTGKAGVIRALLKDEPAAVLYHQLAADDGPFAALLGVVLRVIAHAYTSSSGVLLKHLDSLGKHGLAVETLGGEEAYLTVAGVELVEPAEGNALAVADPVVVEVAEEHRLRACRNGGSVGRGEIGPAKDGVRFAVLKRGLPEVLTGAVLELPDDLHGGVVKHPHRVLAVGSLKAVIESMSSSAVMVEAEAAVTPT